MNTKMKLSFGMVFASLITLAFLVWITVLVTEVKSILDPILM